MKAIVAWFKSIYWLPVLAVGTLGLSLFLATLAAWPAAIYTILVGVFLVLLRISDR